MTLVTRKPPRLRARNEYRMTGVELGAVRKALGMGLQSFARATNIGVKKLREFEAGTRKIPASYALLVLNLESTVLPDRQ